MLEEVTISPLTEMCVREDISVTFQRKSDLVERLHKCYDESFTATPDKKFFAYMWGQWKEEKTCGEACGDYDKSAKLIHSNEFVCLFVCSDLFVIVCLFICLFIV